MGNAKAGAWALILGALSYIALMAVHPSDVGEPIIGALSLSAIVHGTALVMQPVLLYGFWQLTRTMENRPLAETALCVYALSAAMVMLAGTLSGLVIPAIIDAGHVRTGHGAPIDLEALRQTLQGQANYTVMLNRAAASVHVGLFAVAMVLWSIAWPSRAITALLARALGLVCGAAVIVWALSGTMTLEAGHGALLVTLVQMVWTLVAAGALLAAAPKAA
jgi:hypothetical protein